VEGRTLVDNEATASGRFLERSLDVTIRDGRLTIDLGSGRAGSNTCLNWVRIAML
jgi:hypothetical protein